MGLIKAAASAIGSTLHDQWKEYIKCDELGSDILMKKVTTPNGVITKNSAIQVSPGQMAVIFQSGRVLDATCEPGMYTFDESTSPSFFAGDFGDVFKEMWGRFVYNGATNKEQAVYYFNATEIMGNEFGTVEPVPFQDWSHPIPNQMLGSLMPLSLKVRCFGKYTFKIDRPDVFMQEVCGLRDIYRKEELLTDQMRTEITSVVRNLLNELGTQEHKVPVLELTSRTDEITETMKTKVFDEPIRRRGLKIVTLVFEGVSLDDESNEKINNYELSSNSFMQQGTLVGAYANAVQDAANNANSAMNGFMGVGMMNMASGGMVQGAQMNAFNQQNMAASTASYDPYAQAPAKEEVKEVAPVEQVEVKEEVVEIPTEVANEVPAPSPVEDVEVGGEAPVSVEEPVVEETPVVENPAPVTDGFCPDCGTKIVGRFCTGCGRKLSE